MIDRKSLIAFSLPWTLKRWSIHPFIYLSIYPFLSLPLYLSIYLSMCPSIHPSIYLSIYLSIYVFMCLPIHLSILCPSIHLSIYLSKCEMKLSGGVELDNEDFRRGVPSFVLGKPIGRSLLGNQTFWTLIDSSLHFPFSFSFF